MANEIKAPTVERNGGFVFDRVVLEYFNSAGDRFVWDDVAGEWDAFSAYSTDHDIALSEQTIDGQNWYAVDMRAGVGAHTIIPKFFEVGAALTNGNHSYEGIGIPWDGDEIVDLAGLQVAVETIEAGAVVLVPISATVTANEPPRIDLKVCQDENRTFQLTLTDQDGEPSDLESHTIRLVVSTLVTNTVNFELACAVSGDDNNVVSIPVDDSNVPLAGTWKYDLWDTTTDARIAYGGFEVQEALDPA